MSAIRIAKGKAIRILVGGLYPSKSTSNQTNQLKWKKLKEFNVRFSN
jgi:hypothetical protein